MKNFLKIQPEEYVKEREFGQTSFIIKRAIIFALLLIPFNLSIWYFLDDDSKAGINIFTSALISIGLSIIEWSSLEYNYRKNGGKKKLNKIENYGEKEK